MTKGDKYRRVPRVLCAELLDQSWEWRTASGALMTAKPGDFRVWDPALPSSPWSVTAEALAWGYRSRGDSLYESTGEVLARQVRADNSPVRVESLEGEAFAQPGDWIVTDPVGRSWIVPDAEFTVRYLPARSHDVDAVSWSGGLTAHDPLPEEHQP